MLALFMVLFVFFLYSFFFSSRRRHTRYIGDWSSDVCSSDLGLDVNATLFGLRGVTLGVLVRDAHRELVNQLFQGGRSEERRVGKECRCRGGRYHDEKRWSRHG